MPRVGRENAVWAMREELKHYTHLALIDSGTVPLDGLRPRAMANAAFFGMQYTELQGQDQYLRQLLHGPFPGHSFLARGARPGGGTRSFPGLGNAWGLLRAPVGRPRSAKVR